MELVVLEWETDSWFEKGGRKERGLRKVCFQVTQDEQCLQP